MTKDFKSGNVKQLPVKKVNLPNFVNNFSGDNSNTVSYTHLRAHETG